MTLTVADTAYSIAVVRAEEKELFEDPFAKHFAAAGAHAEEGTQRYLSLPFFREGVRLRTRFIDDFVRENVRNQVVLLGAGFDARGLRMPELAKARVYEIDVPSQLERKRAVLDAAGIAIPSNVTYVPVDFENQDFETCLGATDFRPQGGAVFVWEGVIGYIGREEIDRSLASMARLRASLVFTYGEGSFEPESATACLARAGFSRSEEFGFDRIWRRFFPGEPHAAASFSKMGTAFP
jgi:methyltransferase (TIGR00027 family)